MTMPYVPHGQDDSVPESQYEGPKPIDVRVVYTESENVAAEFTALQTWPVPLAGSGQPVQVCPHRYHRYKAKFTLTVPAATTLYLATKPDPLNVAVPSVFQYAIGPGQSVPDYEGQQPLYAVFTGTGPVNISVMDMSYGKVQ